MLEFFGRFHPVFVHLPIGILLLACIFILLSFFKSYAWLKRSIPLILLLGTIGAIVSCLTGYFLANNGEYDHKLVNYHQWMGIIVALFSIILYLIFKKIKSNVMLGTIAFSLIVLISITGHLGGSLTHGADYLTIPTTTTNGSAIPPIANVQNAFVYQDAIQSLFKNRCYSCHGSEKQKGKLRLDKEEFIMKGGKSGPVIVRNNADESELIKRLLLPINKEEHMAPKEKPQLTLNEISLIKWWITNGADFKKKFSEISQPENIKPALLSLQTGETASKVANADLPDEEVPMVDADVLKKLTDAGIAVFPIAQNANYLAANFVNAPVLNHQLSGAIESIEKQLLWLKLEGSKVTDATLMAFSNCKNITKLSLNYSKITDNGLAQLKNLQKLQSLSLVGTKVSLAGINKLAKLKNLKHLYLYQSSIKASDLTHIKSLFPNVSIDTGNYKVPTLIQDTMVVKAPEAKKK
jgi:uncharacterized membrane protein/mono/diheme cytochrome c family protein